MFKNIKSYIILPIFIVMIITVLFVSADLQIRKTINNAVVYIKKIVLTDSWLPNWNAKIVVDWDSWDLTLSWDIRSYSRYLWIWDIVSSSKVKWWELCIWNDCRTSWDSLSTWMKNWDKIYYNTDYVWIWVLNPQYNLDVDWTINSENICIWWNCRSDWPIWSYYSKNLLNDIYYLTGNLWIWADQPSSNIHIKSWNWVDATFWIQSADNSKWEMLVDSSSNNFTLDNWNDVLSISSSWNVWIWTWFSNNKLNVWWVIDSDWLCIWWECKTDWDQVWQKTFVYSWQNIIYSWWNVWIWVNEPNEKLEVWGWVKISNSETDCDINSKWLIRFNINYDSFEWCDWANWVDLWNEQQVYNERVSTSRSTSLIELWCEDSEKLVNAWVEYEWVHETWFYTQFWDIQVNHSQNLARVNCWWSNCKIHIFCVK